MDDPTPTPHRSLLGRLWSYAASSGVGGPAADALESASEPLKLDPSIGQKRALENFTSEALAGAIRRDARPLLEVLAEKGLLMRPVPLEASVETQVPVPTRPERHLDVVVRVLLRDSSRAEIWLENKIHAPVSGDQLRVYRKALDSQSADDVQRFLVWIGPDEPADAHAPYVHKSVRWQSIVDAVARARTDWLWSDLVDFLKENGMTYRNAYPISAREASVLEDAQHLFLKTHAVLQAVNNWAIGAISEWDESHWWKPGQVKGTLLTSLLDRGELILHDGSGYKAYLEYGAATHAGEAWFVVRVVAKSKGDQAIATRVIEALSSTLDNWEQPRGGNVILETGTRAVRVDRQEDAEAWFETELLRLREAAFFKLAMLL